MQRLVFPDAIKAFLICFVVIGHTIGLAYRGQMENYWCNPIITFIYSFHMPLFIAISGYFLGNTQQMNIEVQIKKKFQRLGIPILTICMIYMFIMLVYNCTNLANVNIVNVLLFFYRGITYYWFFDCLLVLSVFCILSEFKGARLGLLIQLGVLVVLIVTYPILPSIFRKLQVVRLLPIFLLSYYVGRFNGIVLPFFLKHKTPILLLSTLMWVGCILVSGVNLLEYSLLSRIFVGLFSSVTILCLFTYIYKFVPQHIVKKGGQNCMGIYLIHAPIFLSLPRINNFLLIVVITILLIVVSSIMTDMIRKTPFKKYILGET